MTDRKMFWLIFTILSLVVDVALPMMWALAATIPVIFLSWWLAYRVLNS